VRALFANGEVLKLVQAPLGPPATSHASCVSSLLYAAVGHQQQLQ